MFRVSVSSRLLAEHHLLFYEIAQNMTHCDVDFLDERAITIGAHETKVRDLRNAATTVASKCNSDCADRFRNLQTSDDILGRTTRRETDDNIAGRNHGFYEARKDVFVAIVVGNSGHRRRVRRHRLRSESSTFAKKSAAELGSKMLCVGCAAAISKPINLMAFPKRLHNATRDRSDLLGVSAFVKQAMPIR